MKFKLTPFARAAFIRAVKTMAQTAVSLLGVGALMSDIDWVRVLSASALSGIMSVLTSVATDLPEAPAGPAEESVLPPKISAAEAVALSKVFAAQGDDWPDNWPKPEEILRKLEALPALAEGGTPS